MVVTFVRAWQSGWPRVTSRDSVLLVPTRLSVASTATCIPLSVPACASARARQRMNELHKL
jgi:hypothetical protein